MTALPGLGVLVICYLSACQAKLILPVRAPRGFNSFDHYPFDELNETLVLHIADAMAAQLLPFGYEYLVIDGGWTESKLPTGTRFNHIDEYGRPIAAPERYPSGIAWLAGQVRQRGLKLGLWTIRGVHADAVRRRTPILGAPGHTADELVDELPVGGGPNGSCLWSSSWLGVNMSHPAAQAYYASRVALLAETYEADFIKADCMMCGPCYTDEVQAFTAAVAASPRELVLSYSPGGGNSVSDGQWVAGQRGAPESGSGALGPSTQPLSSMYRVVTDFHGGWCAAGPLHTALPGAMCVGRLLACAAEPRRLASAQLSPSRLPAGTPGAGCSSCSSYRATFPTRASPVPMMMMMMMLMMMMATSPTRASPVPTRLDSF